MLETFAHGGGPLRLDPCDHNKPAGQIDVQPGVANIVHQSKQCGISFGAGLNHGVNPPHLAFKQRRLT
jgi:hypothetical protein